MTNARTILRRSLVRVSACAALTLFIIGGMTGIGFAQTTPSSAKKDFVLHCADCHGVDGKGNGPATQVIPGIKPADLTLLSKDHDGQFPRQEVFDVIDGRKRMPNHYDPDTDMPLWGLTFQLEGREFGKDSEAKVRARISALVDYIEGIQQK